MNKLKLKTAKLSLILLILSVPFAVGAAMQSSNYIIYENVMHTFDGPVISNVSCTGSATGMTVTWDTSVIADAFVEYSTDSGLASSKEQGSSVKNSTSHSVSVTGLSSATTYYYRAHSERINGGITIDSTIRACTTSAAPSDPTPDPTPSGGGGVLIIDKTDKIPPEITNVAVTDLTNNTATISWQTNEESTSFVEYGETMAYGNTYGNWGTTTDHIVTLINLTEAKTYHFRALSSDDWGNLAKSGDYTFITSSGEEEVLLTEEEEVSVEVTEEGPPETILANASEKLIELLNKFSGQVSLNVLETTLTTQYSAINELADLIPAPILSGEPRVEVGATDVIIYWASDKEANSLVALAPESRFDPNQAEPYLQIVGDSEILTTEHEVQVFSLEPDTIYHFQLRSTPAIGPTATSRDFTFRTRLEALQITSFYSQIIDNQTAVFKWVTNKEADSAITFAPYRGNSLSVEESKTMRDNGVSVIHEVKSSDFAEGTKYDVELSSRDSDGNLATEVISLFSTSEDDFPPQISHIQTDSTIFIDRGGKIQTIISWRTNEPSTTRVYYQEGVVSSEQELINSTNLNTDYTKEHVVVITKFEPGLVYSFRVESIDSGGNPSVSRVHTFMTPKQKESIFQVILRILEETFFWVRRIV
jgi:hypothetical protein